MELKRCVTKQNSSLSLVLHLLPSPLSMYTYVWVSVCILMRQKNTMLAFLPMVNDISHILFLAAQSVPGNKLISV